MLAIYTDHARPLYRFLLRLTLGDREVAEDLLQESLLRAWRCIDEVPFNAARPWLFRVARNVSIDAARARRIRPPETGIGEDIVRMPVPDDAVERMLTSATVRDALLELTPEHRTVLVELYYRGASAAETAARMGIPEGTVKSRVHYALRALRKALDL